MFIKSKYMTGLLMGGIGIETAAEGWVNDAIKFWKDNMKTTNAD